MWGTTASSIATTYRMKRTRKLAVGQSRYADQADRHELEIFKSRAYEGHFESIVVEKRCLSRIVKVDGVAFVRLGIDEPG